MNFDNHITGRNITDDPASPYYTGTDFSGAIFCLICQKHFKDGFELEFEDTIGLLADEELCEDCKEIELSETI